jgi:hypothetical protein
MKNCKRITKTCRQANTASPDKVFPLLCPVREKDWIDRWQYEMIYSQSGVAEKGYVFTTPTADNITTWYITEHDPKKYLVEFVRMTPGELVVKIRIQLSDNRNETTTANIAYEYTSLSEKGSKWIDEELDQTFAASINYWEKAINRYLQTGNKLLKQ